MAEWWTSLGSAGQVFACVAIPATIVLILQTILTLIGLGGNNADDADAHGDAGHDFDAHDASGHVFGHDFDAHDAAGHDYADVADGGFDGDDAGHAADIHDGHDGNGFDGGLRLFTFRGIIAFFSVMGWVGVICCSAGMHVGAAAGIAIAAGIAAMVLLALLMKWLFSLQEDGTENIRDALGVSGTVYLRIPHSRTGRGKVEAVIRGKLSEKNAVTDEATDIAYGEEITVIGISGEDTLIVRRKN